MNPIEKYFNAEKGEGLLFVLVGLIAIAVALFSLLKLKQSFYNGMAYPFIAIALIQLVVGTNVYLRSPKDITRVNQMIVDEGKIKTEEIPRMGTVMKNFVLYRWIEVGLIVIGLGLFFIFPAASFWKGFGLGLAVQAAFMLLLDYFAERRGEVYLKYLQQLAK